MDGGGGGVIGVMGGPVRGTEVSEGWRQGPAGTAPVQRRADASLDIPAVRSQRGTGAAVGPEGRNGEPATVDPAADGDWLTLSPASDSPLDRPSGLDESWRPAKPLGGGGGGAAMSGRGGSGIGAQAATLAAIRGQISPLRLPSVATAAPTIPIVGWSPPPGIAAPAPTATATGSSSPASPPAVLTPTASTVVAPPPAPAVHAIGRSPSRTSALSPLTGGPPPPYNQSPPRVYVLDLNRGVQLFPNYQATNASFDELATLGGSVDLLAQVFLGNDSVSSYNWDTSGLTDATGIGGTGSDQLTFTWNSTNSTAAINTVQLHVQTHGGSNVYQTYSFYVPTGATSTFTAPGIPTVNTPDFNIPDAPTIQTENAQIALQTGALETSVTLPASNPGLDPLVLTYNSATADYRPIFITHFQYESGTFLNAQLQVDGTSFPAYYYALNLIPFGGGQASKDSYIEVALEADPHTMPTSLSTGRHTYKITVQMDSNPPQSTSGYFTAINESGNPVGSGWTIGGPRVAGGLLRLGRQQRRLRQHGGRRQPVVLGHRRPGRDVHQRRRRLLHPGRELRRQLHPLLSGRHLVQLQLGRPGNLPGRPQRQPHDLHLQLGPAPDDHRPL